MSTRRRALFAAAGLPALTAAANSTLPAGVWPPEAVIARRIEEVTAAEIAFAKTMADRDLYAFKEFLAEDTIWLSGKQPLRGPHAVVQAWQKYFVGPKPPFSWAPDLVLVLPSGELAQSSGPVRSPEGVVTARFQSVWRRKGDRWEIVFDQGSEVCR